MVLMKILGHSRFLENSSTGSRVVLCIQMEG
jgi:hypothetical protein